MQDLKGKVWVFGKPTEGVIIQGGTGKYAKKFLKPIADSGTNIAGIVTPGKEGKDEVLGLDIYPTIEDCLNANDGEITTSLCFVPARFVKDAVSEAIDSKIKYVVILAEHVPNNDTLYLIKKAEHFGTVLLGPNTCGYAYPGLSSVGIMPYYDFGKFGNIGVISGSGTATYDAMRLMFEQGFNSGFGASLGGDFFKATHTKKKGSGYTYFLKKFEKDPYTEAVVLLGEMGGMAEEKASEFVKKMKTPVVAAVGGVYAPKGKRMGHAGALVEGDRGLAINKLEVLEKAGACTVKMLSDIPKVLEELKIEKKEF